MGFFGKVFSSLWEGSMVGKADVQLVFMFMIAHANRDGFVEVSQQRIALLTGLPLDRVRVAIDELEAPDPESRTPDEDGRRIIRAAEHRNWGWKLVNYETYRRLRNEEERRIEAAEGMRRLRAERAAAPLTVSNVSHGLPPLAHIEVDLEADISTAPNGAVPGPAAGNPDPGHGIPPDSAASVPQSPVLALTAPGPPPDRGGLSLPLRRGEWLPGRLLESEWRAIYPAVDLERAFANMRGWLIANQERRPTERGVKAFVNTWLRRDQDKAASTAASTDRAKLGVRRGSDARYQAANRGDGNE